MPASDRSAPRRYVSASELAEYAYCPRAWYYRAHPPPGGPDPDSQRRAIDGARFHYRTLASERRRNDWAWGAVVALVVSAALIVWVLWRGGVLP